MIQVQTFFGHWAIRVTNFESFFSERFEILGSNGADGIYVPPDDGTPVDFAVDGAEWAIQFQAKFSDGDWFPYDADRATAVVHPDGLTVTLAIEPLEEPPGGGLVINHHMTARLVSLDPELNPPWPTIPVDFSLPD